MKAFAALVFLTVIGCSDRDQSSTEGSLSAQSIQPLAGDPDEKWEVEARFASKSQEYNRNVAERAKREADPNDPLWSGERSLVKRGLPEPVMNAVVALYGDDRLLCSGTMIAETTVLTAWHCICKKARVDEVRIGLSADTPLDVIPVVYKQPRPCPQDRSEADLALLSLARSPANDLKVQYADVISGPASDVPAIQVVGFGERDGGGVGIRSTAVVTIASRSCATNIEKVSYKCLPNAEFVAIDEDRQVDACRGDSGGPAFVPARSHALWDRAGAFSAAGSKAAEFMMPRLQIVGVVSRGLSPRCGYGTVYAKASLARVTGSPRFKR